MGKSLVKRLDLPTAAHGRSTACTTCKSSGAAENRNWLIPRKILLQLLGMTAGLTISLLSNAVGLGGINVVSALGQPLNAEIGLVAVGNADKSGLVARLASPEAYKVAGLEYPYGIKYSFQLENRANGELYLKLSSKQEINDPFVSLLVELSWASGKLIREYTFLLDPPGYVAIQPKPAAVQTLAPAAVHSAPLRLTPKEVEKKPAVVSTPLEKPVEVREVEKSPEKSSSMVATGQITVRRGDTLNSIAAQIKPDDISLDRMLVALYRANAHQFDGKNMNRVRSGKILRLPDQAELADVSSAEAAHEIHAQSADWNAYRQKLAGAATASQHSEEVRQVATGKITSTAADKTPVASESAKEVLRLSKGIAPGEKPGAAGHSVQDKKNAAAEEAIAKEKAGREEKTRVALLESNLKNMQRLVQLKSEAAALAAAASKVAAASSVASVAVSPAVSAVAAVSEVAAASEVASASAVAAESQAAAARRAATARRLAAARAANPVEEPSLVDDLLDSPLVLGGGVIVLMALGGLGFVLMKRRRKPAEVEKLAEELGGATDGYSGYKSTIVPAHDIGDFTATVHRIEAVTPQPDDVDPISEAELFLNFGRDEQAEEVLKDALQRTPDNQPVRLKLLSIYANRKDVKAFSEIARVLQDSGDETTIEQVVTMGRKIDPHNPMYADATIEDVGSATMFAPPLREEAVGESSVTADSRIAHAAQDLGVSIDFDVTATHPFAAKADPVDFDVTSTSPSFSALEVLDLDVDSKDTGAVDHQEDESMPNLDDLIFDVMTPSAPQAVVDAKAPDVSFVEKAPKEDHGMEFILDFPSAQTPKKIEDNSSSFSLADINLHMGDVSTPAAGVTAAEGGEHWQDVATKLDLAKAYQDMGDQEGAREILDEVMLEGDEAQRKEAESLIRQLG